MFVSPCIKKDTVIGIIGKTQGITTAAKPATKAPQKNIHKDSSLVESLEESVAQQFKDWAFTLTTSILYYNDYDSIDEDTRNLYRKAMAAFGGIAPTYHIELLEKPTIYWDFHSLLLGIQMMFSFMLVDDAKPLRLCKHCQKVFLGSRANSAFCSARCKNQYNVYKSRGKNKGQDGENDD